MCQVLEPVVRARGADPVETVAYLELLSTIEQMSDGSGDTVLKERECDLIYA